MLGRRYVAGVNPEHQTSLTYILRDLERSVRAGKLIVMTKSFRGQGICNLNVESRGMKQ